jgi:TPR repeat protein
MNAIARVLLAATPLFLATTAWSADFDKGLDAYNSNDYSTALTEWQALADAGDANGQYGLGMLYANGFGVELNDEQALSNYGLAAGQGHAEAQYQLGVMHQNGWGVPMNEEEAAKMFEQAAEQGHIDAQLGLAQIYSADYSPLYDKAAAYKWYSIATNLGSMNAAVEREDLAKKLTADEVIDIDGAVNSWMESHGGLVASDQY